MKHVAVTGANGFLGWHTRVAAAARGDSISSIGLGADFDPDLAARSLAGADLVIHLAGVNRAPEAEIADGNALFARQLVHALRLADSSPPTIVYANSVQAGLPNVYGESKAAAAGTLADAALSLGAPFVDLRLPNIFGEHGRPFYNSVVATFSHQLATGGQPAVDSDRELDLLHAQDAADALLAADPETVLTRQHRATVVQLLDQLSTIARTYATRDIPSLASAFERDLFNTYRSFLAPEMRAMALHARADARGSFFEVVRSHGGTGQASFSTTVPGVTRGSHFHRRKVERFVVLSGRALIRMRRLGSVEVLEFEAHGDAPVAIDMPTGWAHDITNVGDEVLFTAFWANDLFDPADPDTHPEAV